MPQPSYVAAILNEVLARHIAKVAAAETKSEVVIDANLRSAITVAGEQFGVGSGHHKAIAHVLCALRGQDVKNYYPPLAVKFPVPLSIFKIVKCLSVRHSEYLNDTFIGVGDVDSDTDMRSLGLLGLDGAKNIFLPILRLNTLIAQPATADEATAFVSDLLAAEFSTELAGRLGYIVSALQKPA